MFNLTALLLYGDFAFVPAAGRASIYYFIANDFLNIKCIERRLHTHELEYKQLQLEIIIDRYISNFISRQVLYHIN